MAVGPPGSLTYTLLLLRFGVGPDWARKVALRRPRFIPLVLSLLVLPGFIVAHSAFHLVLQIDGRRRPRRSAQTQLKAMLAPWPVWVAVLVIGVGPGVIEELFCRGFLGRGLVGRYGVSAGCCSPRSCSGAAHGPAVRGWTVVPMGVLLHVTYLATRSLWVPMLLHFLNNTPWPSCAVLVLESDPTEEMPAEAIPARVRPDGGGLVGAVVVPWPARPVRRGADPDEPRPWRPQFPGVELPPERFRRGRPAPPAEPVRGLTHPGGAGRAVVLPDVTRGR